MDTTHDETGASADAIELLTSDHRTVDQLFTELEAADPAGEVAMSIANEIVKELSVHAAIEEQVLYPAVRQALAEGDELAEHGLDEHQEVKELLSSVDGKSLADPEVMETFRRIQATVEDHVADEEDRMFPELREALGQDRLQQLGRAMAKARALAPTRPHPHAPSTPPGNLIAGPAAGVLDRIRDAARSALGGS